MSTFFFRNGRALALALMLIFAMGVSGLLTIGRQEDPTITNLFATVLTPYPGADPARVEALVTEKIEAELREIAEIAEITSVSRTGLSVIRIELDELIGDSEIEVAWTDVRNALDDALPELPQDVPAPEFRNDASGTYTSISALTQPPGNASDPSLVGRFAEDLQDLLRTVPGTDTVDVFGVAEEEILVEIDPARLTGLGLTPDAVADAVAAADAKLRAGVVRGSDTDLLVEVAGEITELDRIRAVPLGPDAALRVADVAEVRFALEDPPESLAYVDGRPAALVAARMEADLQVDAWMAAVKDRLAAFDAELPAGLEHRQIFDQSQYTTERFAALAVNLGIGIALVTLVLFLTLGFRAALIVASAIPLAALMSVYGMNVAGISIHQMSVTGMIVALGLLVDAAIVMTDEIRQRIQTGVSRLEATGRSVKTLAVPLLASTLTTVLAFVPMAALPGPAGDFVGSIAKSVMIMLAASLVLALTVTPALAGHFLPGPGGSEHPRRWWRDGVRLPAVSRAFSGSLDLALRNPGLAILTALALPVTGFLAFPTLTAQFFPGVDRNQFHVQLRLAGTPSIAVTDAAAARADAILRDMDGITDVAWVVGESAPSFYYNMTMDQDGVAGFAEALVITASPDATVAVIPALQARLNAALPQAQVIVRDLVQGPPVAAPIEVRFVGPDLETLRALGDRTRALMAQVPGITQTRATQIGGAPKLRLDLDEDRVTRAGLDLATVARELTARLDGATGGSLIEGPEELPVRVRVAGEARASVNDVADLQLVAPGGAALSADGGHPGIPLTALGEATVVPADSPIDRRNGERINLVQAFVALGTLPEEALGDLRARLAAEPDLLPPGYRLEFGGDADARAETVNNLLATVALVVTLTLATLVMSFGSFRLTLIALIVAVLATGLSVLALAIFRYPFGINALLGVIGSTGVSINAAIIVLSGLKADDRASAGDVAAMQNVVMGSSRHIVSTTVTTFGGFLPLILAGGGFWPPFAMAVAGGVLLSTVVSFYFTPPMFALLMPPRRAAAVGAQGATPA